MNATKPNRPAANHPRTLLMLGLLAILLLSCLAGGILSSRTAPAEAVVSRFAGVWPPPAFSPAEPAVPSEP